MVLLFLYACNLFIELETETMFFQKVIVDMYVKLGMLCRQKCFCIALPLLSAHISECTHQGLHPNRKQSHSHGWYKGPSAVPFSLAVPFRTRVFAWMKPRLGRHSCVHASVLLIPNHYHDPDTQRAP